MLGLKNPLEISNKGFALKDEPVDRYKIIAEAAVELVHSEGGLFIIPPTSIIFSINVIHVAGIEAEYDWFMARGSDLKKAGKGKYKAVKRETLVPPLLIPLNHLRIAINGISYDFRSQDERITFTTSFKLLFVGQAGEEDVRYSQTYISPKRGHRQIRDVIAPRIAFG